MQSGYSAAPADWVRWKDTLESIESKAFYLFLGTLTDFRKHNNNLWYRKIKRGEDKNLLSWGDTYGTRGRTENALVKTSLKKGLIQIYFWRGLNIYMPIIMTNLYLQCFIFVNFCIILVIVLVFFFYYNALNNSCPVGWGCRIHRLHLCGEVGPSSPISVLDN